ncbi:DUF3592 domain-containing protein [Actinokineospora iranica]|uniref:DUF3592 domain-containing protein n=1 Tax=Actinokineospora iranica TaxID=1271860 RepID=A0A1G6US19_9PSEU|nr:DUF3592 domain-containing protein [Actinokineospora iranica]SDD44099.1 hypothetical protein SAMN05216174_11165 [Actinokineospora iranica]
MDEHRLGRSERARSVTALVAIAVAAVLTALGVLLVVAAFTEDTAIEQHTGRADADVVSVAFNRTLVRFQTPDGAEHVPSVGVLYPEALAEGQVVRVEYDQRDPDLVRVAGRGAALTILPVSTTLLAVWAVVVGLVYALRRRGPLHLRRWRPRRPRV